MQSVKIASIAGIVKRPSPDESQPKRVLLPGKAPIPSNISRGGLDVELPFSVFPAIFLLFFCKSIIVLPTDSLFRCLHLLYQRPVVLKTLRSLTWSVLCTCLLVNSRYVLFLRERERIWKQGWDRCCWKWCNQQILKARKSLSIIQEQLHKIRRTSRDCLTVKLKFLWMCWLWGWGPLSIHAAYIWLHWFLMQVQFKMHYAKECNGVVSLLKRGCSV